MRRVTRFLFRVILILLLWSVGGVMLYKYVPVPVTPLMVRKAVSAALEGKPTTFHHTWVPMEKISPHLVSAVIASEDQRFYQHKGFDWKEIGNAIEERQSGKRQRGGSTISQQTAKNVFLFPSRSFVRKGFEAYFTFLIECFWSKERILEVYLNVAEMGKGIYGAEAAAQQIFDKPASDLTRRESSLIAACLPNPIQRNAGKPSAYVSKRAGQIRVLIPKIAYPEWINHE